MNRTPLDPKIDVVFRALFGREENVDILRAMLNAVLGLQGVYAIQEISYLQPTHSLDYIDEKESVVDLVVRDGRGREVVVEMQCRNHAAFPERILYYGARRVAYQLRAGEPYFRLRPVIVLVFTDFDLVPALQGYRHRFTLREQSTGVEFSQHLEIMLVELPKFVPATPAAHATEPQSYAPWIRFLKEGSSMSAILSEPWVNADIRKAVAELERLAADESMRELYERRLLSLQLRATELQESFEEGREEGREEGERKGLLKALELGLGFRFEPGATPSIMQAAQRASASALRGAVDRLQAGEPLESVRQALLADAHPANR
jgi:predicted transposase/invertase (TIGR01784 family)